MCKGTKTGVKTLKRKQGVCEELPESLRVQGKGWIREESTVSGREVQNGFQLSFV